MSTEIDHKSPLSLTTDNVGQPKIVAENLNKTFINDETGEEVVAIENLNFTINDQEFVAIIGPSGCGKSTILYLIAGFEGITSGRLAMDGHDLRGPGPDRGIVFQEFVLFPWRTVLRNITLGLEMQKVPQQQAEERAHKWIELTGLSGFEDAYPATLSGGMKQRVAIARALAYDPDVILLDEPFGALDVQTKNYMIRDLQKLWQEANKTILMVTHSVSEAVVMADRVVVSSARPARIIFDERINIPRPRDPLDPKVVDYQREVTAVLSAEVDKAMQRETERF